MKPEVRRTAPRGEDLRDSGSRQRRWMSLPASRLVVNPYDFYSPMSPADYSDGPDLPLNAGYYAGGDAFDLPALLMLYRRESQVAGGLEVAWEDSFDAPRLDWQVEEGLEAEARQGRAVLTVTGEVKQYGAISRWVEIDLDRHPYVQVKVTEARGHWALKVSEGGDESQDIVLQGDVHRTGEFAYHIPRATGWSGRKRFLLRLYAVWENCPMTVERIRLLGLKEVQHPADRHETAWLPHELPFSAEYGPAGNVKGQDHFYDTDTLVRGFRVESTGEGRDSFTLAGRYTGAVSWDRSRSVLTVETDTFAYAVALSQRGPERVAFYPSTVEFLAGVPAPEGGLHQGIWSLDLPAPEEGPTVLTVGFATAEEGCAVAVERARRPLEGDAWKRARSARRAFWDRYLEGVPHPHSFALHQVADQGVTPEAVRRAYYTAWVFLAANVLSAMPESGFPFPQLPAGKPSLWAEGHPLAKPSASWESLLAMQLYAYVDPALAAEACRGMMSLIDEAGLLGGESLPSRKAQTAIVLYQLTGDRDLLEETYPALKRYLLWRRDNPRWIHKAHDFADEKDADFVVSAIIDMGYAGEIAGLLGQPEEERFWQAERKALFQDYLEWFWTSPTAEPVQYSFVDSGRRSRGNTLWVSTGLHVDSLQGTHLESLLQRFRRDFQPSETFGGFPYPKYPEIAFTVYGLLARGLLEEAGQLANISVRDVVRANMFAEQYDASGHPRPDGVRPSFFGVGDLIDMLWIKNGYRMDRGAPCVVQIPGESGGVSNLRIQGKRFDMALEPDAQSVLLSGDYIQGLAGERRVRKPLPPGKTVAVSALAGEGD